MTDSELLHAVCAAAAAEFDVLGEIARDASGLVVFLARDLASGELVVLKLSRGDPEEAGQDEYSLEVARELDPSLPDIESHCPRCGAKLRRWARFCTQCGGDISGVGPSSRENLSRDTLRHAVRAAAASEYDVLGEIPRAEGGGLVYFARDRKTGTIVALRLQRESESEYALDVTRVLTPLPAAGARSTASRNDPVDAVRRSRPVADHGPTTRSSAPAPPSAEKLWRASELNALMKRVTDNRSAVIGAALVALILIILVVVL